MDYRTAAFYSTILCLLLITGCIHPIDINGEGEVLSSSGERHCHKDIAPCEFEIVDAYVEVYEAIPDEGHRFVNWDNCALLEGLVEENGNSCSYNIPQSAVKKNWLKRMPALVANFEPIPQDYIDASNRMREIYQDSFGLNVPLPAVFQTQFDSFQDRHNWISTAYIGAQIHRIYLWDDGRVNTSTIPVQRPVGDFRVVVVAIDHGNTDIAQALGTGWVEQQTLINQAHAEYAQQQRLAAPIVSFSNTNLLAQSNEIADPLSYTDVLNFARAHGFDEQDFDILVSLNMDAANPSGGLAAYGSNFVYMGYFFEASDQIEELGTDKLGGLAHALYHHEFGHIWGWEHEWSHFVKFTDAPLITAGDFITQPILLGWTDTDGDGIPEVLDPTPYGRAAN